ncbi:uncharacterized protein LAJ45_05031 [Morchella importuna]|uniref:uncharacterized protein n=1 Tax=Morchella importuna TaxID=1174673 RepID=UPI001E8D4E9A|nr:uncharacterized protein LAJ45_05031 [Morchella importuna]KAH8150850.1 hypothetical protein LAJ45_05031 [Morchella importuna]
MASQRIATWAATNVGVVTSGTVILVGALTTWDNHRGRDHQVTTIETNLGTRIGDLGTRIGDLGTRIGDLGTRIDVVDKKVDEVKEEIKHTQAIALGAAYVSFTGNQAMKNKWAKDIENEEFFLERLKVSDNSRKTFLHYATTGDTLSIKREKWERTKFSNPSQERSENTY